MVSIKTINLYQRVLKQALANKQEIINDHNKLLFYFNEMPASSQRTAIAAFRFFKDEFNISENQIVELKKHYKPHTNKKEFHYMTQDHINKLRIYLSTCKSIKEKIIITILFDLGVRKFEVAKVVQRYFETRNSDFQIIGKKSTVRKVFLTNEVEALLRKANLEHDEQTIIKWCSLESVYNITKKVFKFIGFNGACHDFRRHFAQNLDEKGERISVIKTLMGHSNIATTSIYIKQNDNELKKVIQNQHKQRDAVDLKHHIEMTNRVDELVKQVNEKDEFIKNLLTQIENLTTQNTLLTNQYNDLLNHFNRLKNKNKYIKENKRAETLIKRKINKYEQETIQELFNSL